MSTGKHPLDSILIPTKAFVFRHVLRGDERRYLALRNSVSQAAARARLYEPQTVRALRSLVGPGAVVLDVGASFGVYTSELARLVGPNGQVHAFEPQPAVYELLVRRFRGKPSVHVVNAALADRSGSALFVIPTISTDIPETALGALSRGDDGLTLSGGTTVTTLDEYCSGFTELAFIKIDAEGWDLDVLKGGAQTLERLRPVVQIEVNDNDTLAAINAFAARVGYEMDDRVLSGVNRLLRPS